MLRTSWTLISLTSTASASFGYISTHHIRTAYTLLYINHTYSSIPFRDNSITTIIPSPSRSNSKSAPNVESPLKVSSARFSSPSIHLHPIQPSSPSAHGSSHPLVMSSAWPFFHLHFPSFSFSWVPWVRLFTSSFSTLILFHSIPPSPCSIPPS
ncbi:hypothetical protein BDV59DRAFT_1231 [Aspergillus ambiguus]|uniref:uncharacterized protein n=1 Tax=Aspergillus ambiguus TaxID=176160 RepID=UPI003CCCB134